MSKHKLPSARAIGERIRRARERAGLTAAALGAWLGVSGHTVFLWEAQGRMMQLVSLWRLADAMGCSLDDLAPTGFPRREDLPIAPDCSPRAIGARLRELRLRGGLAQQELARRIRAYSTAVVDWESGRRNMSARFGWRICAALECSLEDLLPTGRQPLPRGEAASDQQRAPAAFDPREKRNGPARGVRFPAGRR
jgi:transcriptional regulator with XRE-family HTH domain